MPQGNSTGHPGIAPVERSTPRRLVPDGGFESGEAVEALLEDGPLFELTHRAGEKTRRYPVVHDEITRPSAKPLGGPPVFRFRNLTTGERFRVELPELVGLEPVEFGELPEPLRGQALGVVGKTLGGSVPVATVEQALAFAEDGTVDPEDVLVLGIDTLGRAEVTGDLADRLFGLLAELDGETGQEPLLRLAARARAEPASVTPHVGRLVELLAAGTHARGASRCLATVAESEPERVLDAVPALAAAAESGDTETRRWVVYAFSKIAGTHPEALLPAVSVLVASIRAGDDNLRTNALAALGKVVDSYPDAAVTVADELAGLLGDEDPQVRGNATGLLADIAQEHPATVCDHAEALATRLDDDAVDTRVNASIALNRAGEADPDAVRRQRDRLRAALEDDQATVRANVCTLVGNARVPVETDRLERLRAEDPDEAVREQAARALERLKGR